MRYKTSSPDWKRHQAYFPKYRNSRGRLKTDAKILCHNGEIHMADWKLAPGWFSINGEIRSADWKLALNLFPTTGRCASLEKMDCRFCPNDLVKNVPILPCAVQNFCVLMMWPRSADLVKNVHGIKRGWWCRANAKPFWLQCSSLALTRPSFIPFSWCILPTPKTIVSRRLTLLGAFRPTREL